MGIVKKNHPGVLFEKRGEKKNHPGVLFEKRGEEQNHPLTPSLSKEGEKKNHPRPLFEKRGEVNIKEAIGLANKIRKVGKKLVVVGGSFDILHVGHVIYLEKAKKKGEVLMVLLESDERIKRMKGEKRPINKQADRAKLLLSLRMVDVVVCLSDMKSNEDYDDLLAKIKPSIIAVEGSDQILEIKKRQAEMVGAKLVVVTKRIGEYSSSGMVG